MEAEDVFTEAAAEQSARSDFHSPIPLTPSHDAACVSIKYSASGKYLATASADRSAIIYRSKLTGQHTAGLNDCAFSQDNESLFTASDDKTIKMWNVETSSVVTTLTGHTGYVYCLAVNPKSGIVISGSYDNQIRMWDPRARTPQFRVIDAHSEPVTALDFSSDGTEFISGSFDGNMRLWTTVGGQCLLDVQIAPEVPPISGLRYYNKENKELLLFGLLDSSLRLLQIERSSSLHPILNLKLRKKYEGQGYVNTKYSMFSCISDSVLVRDSICQCVISGSEDSSVRIWSLNSKKLEYVLRGHSAPVIATACATTSTVGRPQIISADLKGSALLWTQRDR